MIKTVNLQKIFKTEEVETWALNNVSIEVKQGEFVAIMGPSGCGKSTLLKCIYRTLKQEAGCVMLDGTDISRMSYKQSAKKLAVLAQHNYYNFEFTVQEVVLMGRSPHKKALERDTAADYEIVQNCLEKVGMAEFSKRNFSTLSGGEQQRVILARALAQQTPCLVLDEPTNHLDITHQLQLLKIVKELDCTVISAIHDLNIAAMFCDRIYVLQKGKIMASGTPKEVFTPQLLREIYQVDAEVVYDSKGNMHVLFM